MPPLFIKIVDVGPTPVGFYRLLFGGIFLSILAVIRRERLLPSPGALGITFLAALAFSGDLFCWHQSILLVGPGLATILANFQVFILAVIGVLFLGEKLTPRLIIAIAGAFIGLFLLLESDITKLPPDIARGTALGLITAVFFAVYILALRKSQSMHAKLPLMANMAWVSLMGAAILALAVKWEGASFALPDLNSGLLLAVYGVACQALGWLLLSAGLPLIPPVRGGLLILGEPIFSFIWDLLFFKRPTGPWGFAGAGIAIAAIYIALSGKKQIIRKK